MTIFSTLAKSPGITFRGSVLLVALGVGGALFTSIDPAMGMLIGWLIPLTALFLLKRKTFFADPRTYGLAGLAFWSVREVGGTLTRGFPAEINPIYAAEYVALLCACAVSISAFPEISKSCQDTFVSRIPRYSLLVGILAASAVGIYIVIPDQAGGNEYALPARAIMIALVCGQIVSYRGASLWFALLALLTMWTWDIVNSVNRTGILQIPVYVALAFIIRFTFVTRAQRLLKSNYLLFIVGLSVFLVPLSVATKDDILGSEFTPFERYFKFFEGKVEFPFLAEPSQYFSEFQRNLNAKSVGTSIVLQIALSPIPRSVAPWKPQDMLHYLNDVGLGDFLYIETFLLAVADMGLFGPIFYSCLAVICGYVAFALLQSGANRSAFACGMLVPIYYTIFMSQSGYPFSIAQTELGPLSLLILVSVFRSAIPRVKRARVISD